MTTPLRVGIIVFPGSNCDRDCFHALTEVLGASAEFVWHKTDRLPPLDFPTATISAPARSPGSRR
jgi:phosphoribosylformylglycinamidine (FGAM) synthase-like amidotransferase family enzyme